MAPEGAGDPVPNRETAIPPSRRVEELEAKLERLEDQLQERTQALARLQSDYKSYKQRVKREREETKRDAQADIVDVLADVLDDVERAMSAEPSDDVRKGLELVNRRIEDQLEAIDAQRVEPSSGEDFDPELHEALMTHPTDEQEPDTILEVLQPGYRLGDRIVRAARVTVAKAPADD